MKEFAHYHVPERSLTYLIEPSLNTKQAVPGACSTPPNGACFSCEKTTSTNELLRLHQYREVEFEQAGTLVQLSMRLQVPLQYCRRTSGMTDLRTRLTGQLEPMLRRPIPAAISAYHDMPYALFRYDPKKNSSSAKS